MESRSSAGVESEVGQTDSNANSRVGSYNRGLSKVNYNPMRGINFSEPQSIPDIAALRNGLVDKKVEPKPIVSQEMFSSSRTGEETSFKLIHASDDRRETSNFQS